jgi:hypothetical protein
MKKTLKMPFVASHLRQALADADYDTNAYELNAAMAMALADSTPKRRFEKHKKAFVGMVNG